MNLKSICRLIAHGLRKEHTYGFMGNHGTGKTSFVKNKVRALIAKRHNLPIERVHIITRCVSVMDPADLIGNFQELGGRTYNCPPSWIPVCKEYDDEMLALYNKFGKEYAVLTNEDDVYVLFLDECKRGNPVIQDAIMELLLEHTIFGVKLHKNTYVFCADNDNIAIYNGTKRDPAQESRIKNIKFGVTNSEYLEDYKERVDNGEIHPIILKFLSENQGAILTPTATLEQLATKGEKGPCPRDWTQLGESLKEFADNDDDITVKDFRFLKDHATSFVGSAQATKFMEYCKKIAAGDGSVEPEDILEKFDDVKEKLVKIFDTDATNAVTLCDGLVEICKDADLAEYESANIAKFLTICPDEAVVSFCKHWMEMNKTTFNTWRCTPLRHKLLNNALMSHDSKNGGKSAYDKWVDTFTRSYKLTVEQLDSDTIVIGK